jgi:3-polyprenyl-4-hydroxybenzoate decarboxylase
VAVIGASGVLYAVWIIAVLLERGCHLELVVTDFGWRKSFYLPRAVPDESYQIELVYINLGRSDA